MVRELQTKACKELDRHCRSPRLKQHEIGVSIFFYLAFFCWGLGTQRLIAPHFILATMKSAIRNIGKPASGAALHEQHQGATTAKGQGSSALDQVYVFVYTNHHHHQHQQQQQHFTPIPLQARRSLYLRSTRHEDNRFCFALIPQQHQQQDQQQQQEH